jgi:DNA helicase-2/ATP-dependent DNA helicase PcrA
MTASSRLESPPRPDPAGGYLRDVLATDFTAAQVDVATHALQPQLVVAGAGSGKTTVMAARIVHAVAVQGVAPSEILGLTFTNKAAGELAARVRRSLAHLLDSGVLRAPSEAADSSPIDDLPTVATYHAYAAGIVRDHALRIGREPGLILLSEAARWQLALRVVRRALGPFDHLTWTTGYTAEQVLSLAGELAEHLVTTDDVRRHDERVHAEVAAGGGASSKAVRELVEALGVRSDLLRLVDDYNAAKHSLDVIDFGDQVALAAQIVRSSGAVVALERSRFRLVVLDEYQDTGVAQRILLSTLFSGGHPVVAVGDPNQAIYGWRGASLGNLINFDRHFPRAGGVRFGPQPLMTSFRSGGRILAAANVLAGPIGGGGGPAFDVPRLSPMPERGDCGEVRLARLATDQDEAGWVADRLAEQVGHGVPPGEMAVLVRRRADFGRLHRALLDRGLPVEVVGLGGLLQMPEVADVVALLSIMSDPSANAAALRILTGPRWRLGIRDLAALGARADRLARAGGAAGGEDGAGTGAAAHQVTNQVDDSGAAGGEPAVRGGVRTALAEVLARSDEVDVPALVEAIDSPGDPGDYSAEGFERLRQLRLELRALQRLTGQPLVDLVTEVVRSIGLDVEIEAAPARSAVARSANLAAFLDQAARFSGLDGQSDLSAFLAYLQAAEAAEDGLDAGTVSTADTVKLMTVHKAKGLEWDVVAVPGLVENVFPSDRGRPVWTGRGGVLPTGCRGDRDDLPALAGVDASALLAFKAASAAADVDEERRLAYVAVTRARHLLLASGYCWSGTRRQPVAPSRFLTELASAGKVVVDDWCADPAVGDPHPLRVNAAADVPWPADIDDVAADRRRAAAAAVRSAVERRRSPGSQATPPAHHRWQQDVALVLDEVRRERAVVRDVALPRRLTASQIVELAHDPDALARSLARPTPSRPIAQARRGSRFHAWAENLWSAASLLDSEDLPGAEDADLSDTELTELKRRFTEAGWSERRPVAVEQPFELVVAGRLLRGRIDAVYGVGPDGEITSDGTCPGGYDVIDYKTGDVPRDFAAASLQLSIYRLAWADVVRVDPERVRAGFLYVRTASVKRPERLLSRDELAALIAGGQETLTP